MASSFLDSDELPRHQLPKAPFVTASWYAQKIANFVCGTLPGTYAVFHAQDYAPESGTSHRFVITHVCHNIPQGRRFQRLKQKIQTIFPKSKVQVNVSWCPRRSALGELAGHVRIYARKDLLQEAEARGL